MVACVRDGGDGSDAVITRMADVLLVELLRGTAVAASRGWRAALHDPQIGRALALIHADPKARWDAELLRPLPARADRRHFPPPPSPSIVRGEIS